MRYPQLEFSAKATKGTAAPTFMMLVGARRTEPYSEIRGNLVDFFFGFAVFFSKKRCKGIEKSQNSGLVQSRKCKARKTLKNDALDAKIGVDTAVNEPLKV